jgi:uncharacterized protein YkwD
MRWHAPAITSFLVLLAACGNDDKNRGSPDGELDGDDPAGDVLHDTATDGTGDPAGDGTEDGDSDPEADPGADPGADAPVDVPEDCVPVPGGTEVECNGVDEDCDGQVDEDFEPGACGEGACRRDSTCTGGVEECTPGSTTGDDTDCDDVDDDCDGTADEHYISRACGTGACERDSTCTAGIEDCTPGSPSADTDCDDVDDDCDGTADEHYVSHSCGTGPCERESTCVRGVEDCTPGSPGVDDDCDTVDDDCDGRSDEHYAPYTCGWGPVCTADSMCSAGTETCTPACHDSLWSSTWATNEVDVVTAINAERASGAFCNGSWYPPVSALTMDPDLREAARCHSLDMATNDFFSHTGSDGRNFVARCTSAGYSASPRGENIAAGYTTPVSAVAGWMASTTGHCEMIMNSSVNEVGIGYVRDSSATWTHYWTAVFGRR